MPRRCSACWTPQGLRDAFLTYVRAGLLTSSYVPWNGNDQHYWYAQNPFAEMRIIQDYLTQTGDIAFLELFRGAERRSSNG